MLSFARPRRVLGLVAIPVLVLGLVTFGPSARAAVTCSWEMGLLTITMTETFDQAGVVRSGTDILVSSGETTLDCSGAEDPMTTNTHTIAVEDATEAQGPLTFEIDRSGGHFADPSESEPDTPEIEFTLELAGDDVVVITGGSTADVITIGAGGINLGEEDCDVDVTLTVAMEHPVVHVFGGDGGDTINAGDPVPCVGGPYPSRVELEGGAGDDILTGGSSGDFLAGGPDNDQVFGGDGDDLLYEGSSPNGGDDPLDGQAGFNTIDYSDRPFGSIAVTDDGMPNDGAEGEGDNVVLGMSDTVLFPDPPPPPPPPTTPPPTTPPPTSPGPSTPTSSPTPDPDPPPGCDPEFEVCGTDGDDQIEVTGDDMTIVTGDGDDTINATGDNLTIICGNGSDDVSLEGADGTVRCRGGDDSVFVDGTGNKIFGEAGDDTLVGAGANDNVAFFFRFFVAQQAGGGDAFFGGIGSDVILAGDGADLAKGGFGPDLLKGGAKADELRGGDLRDEIRGGPGFDDLFGGNGKDSCFGGKGSADFQGCEFTKLGQKLGQ